MSRFAPFAILSAPVFPSLSLIASLVLIVTMSAVVTSANALTPTELWSHRYGAAGADAVNAMAMDASGNVAIVGSFSGTVDFGGGVGLVSAGGTDIFIADYTSAGTYNWSRRIGGTSDEAALALAFDGAGDPVIAGYFNGTVDFGGGVGLVSAGGRDIFVTKYNKGGTYQWASRFGGSLTDEARGIAADATSNVYLTGLFAGNITMGGPTLMSAGSSDIFLAKFNTAGGVWQWSTRFGSTNADEGNAVWVDASGNPLITGMFNGTVNFGGVGLVSAANDIYLAKYNSAGTHQWSQNFGSVGDDRGLSVTTDASSNVFMTGFFSGSANFGGGALVPVGSQAVFLAKYNSVGAHQWSKQTGTMTATGRSVAIDHAGNVLLTGDFQGYVDFGAGPTGNAGGDDVFIARYTNAGLYKSSYVYGSVGGDRGVGVIANRYSLILSVFLTGNFVQSINFGGSNLITNGLQDLFLVKFAAEPLQPVIRSISDIGNDQGRQVLINFTASGDDQSGSELTITGYEAYRKVASPPPSSMTMDNLSTGQLLAEGWTQVGAISAHGETGYTLVAPTIGDSTIANGQYRSTFYLRATTASPYTFYDSPPDSGYSKDNLAPGVPSSFAYSAGQLTWHESSAKDFDYFTVYGSNTDSFGAATVVDYSVATAMNVISSPYVYYYVTATDFSGNEGKPAKINSLTGVGGTPTSYVLSVSNYPNPFNPRTTVSYTVPSRGAVTVGIYDAHGAHVATLFHGERVAGAYSVDWDGRTDDAAVAASGVYFARIEHSSGTRTKKMVLLK